MAEGRGKEGREGWGEEKRGRERVRGGERGLGCARERGKKGEGRVEEEREIG